LPERWRKPAEVLDVRNVHQGIWLPDGRLEPFEHPWPERCHVCGAPVRDKQAEYFAQEFAGEVKLGSTQPLDDGGMWERIERERKERPL
jgi:hypothetical protein